jgi:hypothetical protein
MCLLAVRESKCPIPNLYGVRSLPYIKLKLENSLLKIETFTSSNVARTIYNLFDTLEILMYKAK